MTKDQADRRSVLLNRLAKHPMISYGPIPLPTEKRIHRWGVGQFYDRDLVGVARG